MCMSACVKGELTRGPPIPKIPLEAREELSPYIHTHTMDITMHYNNNMWELLQENHKL